jgi:hypothetical protein
VIQVKARDFLSGFQAQFRGSTAYLNGNKHNDDEIMAGWAKLSTDGSDRSGRNTAMCSTKWVERSKSDAWKSLEILARRCTELLFHFESWTWKRYDQRLRSIIAPLEPVARVGFARFPISAKIIALPRQRRVNRAPAMATAGANPATVVPAITTGLRPTPAFAHMAMAATDTEGGRGAETKNRSLCQRISDRWANADRRGVEDGEKAADGRSRWCRRVTVPDR